jgi:glycerol-3-phosphate responsive antiterminator
MNDELERICKEASRFLIEVLPGIFPKGLRQTAKKYVSITGPC